MSDVTLPRKPLNDTRSRKDLYFNVIQALLGVPLSDRCACSTLSDKDLLYNMVLAADGTVTAMSQVQRICGCTTLSERDLLYDFVIAMEGRTPGGFYFAEIQFPSGDEFAQSGSSDYLRLYLGSGGGNPSHVFWGQAGTSIQPTGLTGTITYHEIDVEGLEADEVRDLFCQSIVNTGLWTIPGFSVQTAPVNTVPPTIDNETPTDGETINVTNGTWTMTPTSYTYQWFADAVEIVGATSSAYEVEEAVGVELTCEVTAHNSIGASDPELTSNVATVSAAEVWTDSMDPGDLTTPDGFLDEFPHSVPIVAGSTGNCTALRTWVSGFAFTTGLKMALYDNSGNLLQNATGTVTGTGWFEIAITPEPVTASTTYRVSWCLEDPSKADFDNLPAQPSGTSLLDFSTSYAAFPIDPDGGGPVTFAYACGMLIG